MKTTQQSKQSRSSRPYKRAKQVRPTKSAGRGDRAQSMYLESSALARAVQDGISGAQIRARLSELGWEPMTGLMVIYEACRKVVHPRHSAVIRHQLRVLADLEPALTRLGEDVMRQEVAFANGGPAVCHLIDEPQAEHYRSLVRACAEGVDDPTLLWIVGQREVYRRATMREIVREARARALRIRQTRPHLVEEGRQSPERAAELLGFTLKQIVAGILAPGFAPAEYDRALERSGELPRLMAELRTYQRLFQIVLEHDSLPRTDQPLDPQHLADASYCDRILTADFGVLGSQLMMVAPSATGLHWLQLNFKSARQA